VVDLTHQLEDGEGAEFIHRLDNQLSFDSHNFYVTLCFNDAKYFDKVEEINNNNGDSSDVVTNTGVGDTDRNVGNMLPGEVKL
jgi:hypothetical protein